MSVENQFEAAEHFYNEGNNFRQKEDWQHALECYNRAIELNPNSPAVMAKEILTNILNYYCKELFNP